MSLLSRLRALVRNVSRSGEVERELDEELRSYAAMLEAENLAAGMDEHSARRAALLAVGGMEQVKEQVRDVRGGAWLDSLLQDVRYAMRSLAHSPAFTITAALSIALGVGANAGVFTLVNSLMLRPLPVDDPATLTVIYGAEKNNASGVSQLSRLNFLDLAERARSFSQLAGTAGPAPLNLARKGSSVAVFSEFATASFFDVLGLRPAAGRFFRGEEDRTPGTHPVAVIAYGTWQRRFGGDPSMVGETVRLNGVPVTVIGVAPRDFRGLSNFFGPELWVPSVMAETLLEQQGRSWLRERETAAFNVIGRLRGGVAREQAQAELQGLAAGLEKEYPNANRGRTVVVRPVAEASLFPGLREGLMVGGAFLLGVVGLILLIACSNVANLLLARGVARRQEIAVRLALGAPRARIVRQLLTESVILALLGGLTGVGLAAAVKQGLWSLRPAVVAESLVEPRLSGVVLVFALLVSVAAGFLFGLFPALQASAPAITGRLQEEARAGGGRRQLRAARGLVAAQVCLAAVCLVIAGLYLRAVADLYSADPGFETKRLAILSASPGEAGYSKVRSQQYFRELRERMERLPGVVSAAWASNALLFGGPSRGIAASDAPSQSQQRTSSSIVNVVEPDYFRTIGLPLLTGRDFGSDDSERAVRVAIVNRAFADAYWPGKEAVGRRFRFSGENTDRMIVGVVKTAALVVLGEPAQPCVYLPMAQSPQTSMVLYLRTAADPRGLLGLAQGTLRDADPEVPLGSATTARELMDNNLWIARVVVGLFAAFGLLGLALSSVGLYGVMAYTVGRRRREIGIRMALGANRVSVIRAVFLEGISVVAAGTLAGLALGSLAGQALAAAVSSVPAADPASFGGTTAVLLGVASVACWIPAWRASRVDPAITLREG